MKTREVKCLDDTWAPSPDCDKNLKPSRRQPCNTQPCQENKVSISEPSDTATHEAFQMDGLASTEGGYMVRTSMVRLNLLPSSQKKPAAIDGLASTEAI